MDATSGDGGALRELGQELRRALRGEVCFDPLTRQLYSTDASEYRIVPSGVVIPKDGDDIAATVELAGRYGVSLVPRGSGTSLSGQAVGPGLVIDHSRHLDHILEINAEERWARVEAGVVLEQLNQRLQGLGLMVGPDPASAAVATLGGMAGNNSTGSHSIRYGLMVDHVRAVEVVLADGRRVQLGSQSADAIAALRQRSTLEGALYRGVPELLQRYREAIAEGYPRTWRNVAGYNLHRVLADWQEHQSLNLASLIVGSEGTLANIVSLTVNLVPRPAHTRLVILHFDDLRAALESVPWLLEMQPAAIELMGEYFIGLASGHPQFGPRLRRFVQGQPRAVLIIELAGDEAAQLAAQARTLEHRLRRHGYAGPVVHAAKPEAIENVWTVRREAYGLLLSRVGDARPLSVVDDTAVPVEALADYVTEVERICRQLGVEVAIDGHASAGCLHISPVLNLKTAEGLRLMQLLSQAITEAALVHGGTTSGEHGEGLARSHYNERLFGPRLHQAFREVKGLFDPHNLLNPGKIVNAPQPWQPELLRFHPGYDTPLAPRTTWLDFSRHGGLPGLAERCNGQGFCRQLRVGVMCPSFKATRREMDSTRGRANALRAALTGQLGPEGLTSPALYQALDLCLECKACRSECSAQVDMARLKYEFLAHYQARHGVPLRSWLFAHVATLYRLGSRAPRIANWLLRQHGLRWVLDRVLGIDRRRPLPAVAPVTFQRWFRQRPRLAHAWRGPVILWDDTYLSYLEPEIGQAAVELLEAAGFEVRLAVGRRCCGRPLISKGLLDEARKVAAHNVALLAPWAAQGVPIIGLEPSCLATFRDEYPDLLSGQEVHQVARQSFFIEEFLCGLQAQGALNLAFAAAKEPQHVLVHGHCYQKALIGTQPLLEMLRLLPDTTVEEIAAGCCGGAGAFAYEKEHYQVSLACAEDRLFPAVRAAPPDVMIAAAGFSCRQQIMAGTGRRSLHPIVVMAARLQH